jgi:DNA-binding SARP family transcriptional activator
VRIDLGPIRVTDDQGEVVLGPAKVRSSLAVLALRPAMVVPSDELVAALWGEQPPATARRTLQTHVANGRNRCATDSGVFS